MRKIFVFAFLIITLFGCINSAARKESAAKNHLMNPPDSIYIHDDILLSIDSLQIFHNKALTFLNDSDTVGAQIYFESALKIIATFDDQTKSVLMEWTKYDSLLHDINSNYNRIYKPESKDFEAEEIREELSKYEDEMFGDSTVTDTSFVAVVEDSNAIPLEINGKVELALKYFQTKGRGIFSIWLKRTGKYEQMAKEILREEGVPEDLFYLAMIESGLNPKAYSYARASGMWQFMYSTGSAYGLRSGWWFDERRDPLLATRAAARHLSDLYERFGDWYLALAGYNYSPGKIQRKMRIYNTRDFWKLKRLPRQTRNYVPTYIAATLIAKNPEKYGFFVEKAQAVEYDTVHVSECVDLSVIAEIIDVDYQSISELNPAIRRWCTPPGVKNFTLNIPEGTKEKFKEGFAKLPEDKKRFYVRHKIRYGETLSEIAEKYRTSISIIKSYNNLRGSMIRAGRYLIIPAPKNKKYYSSYKTPYKKTARRSVQKITNVPNHKKIIYIVRKGDTLGEIAENYNTLARKIRKWNGLRYGEHIYPDQKLALWLPEEDIIADNQNDAVTLAKKNDLKNVQYYLVKKGDTLWDIALKHNISVSQLKKLNNLKSNKIKPGEKLVIKKLSEG